MGELGKVQRVVHLSLAGLLDPHQGQTGGFRTGIDLEDHRLQRALLDAAVLETDCEGAEPMDHGTLACKQEPCAPRGTRHERLFVLVEHKHHGCILSVPSDEGPVTGLCDGPEQAPQDAPFAAVALACWAHRTDLYPDRFF